jgi:hypothetical protein
MTERIVTVHPNQLPFMVNPVVVKDGQGRIKKDRHGRIVHRSANHIDLRTGTVTPHPYSFMFVVSK